MAKKSFVALDTILRLSWRSETAQRLLSIVPGINLQLQIKEPTDMQDPPGSFKPTTFPYKVLGDRAGAFVNDDVESLWLLILQTVSL